MFTEARKLVKDTHVKVRCLAGGEPMAEAVLGLRGGLDLAIGTPGRLLQLVEERRVVSLSRLRLLVLDEADAMLDLGFEQSITRLVSGYECVCVEASTD